MEDKKINEETNEDNDEQVSEEIDKEANIDKKEFEFKKMQELGQGVLKGSVNKPAIHLLNIIGEIEGHIVLPQNTKSTKYEHVLPELAAIENNDEIKGVLILLNTVGGDVEAGLAISELIASISKPTVSLVLGGSHSIGGPLAVAANYSFIVPSATMIIHPVRMSGTILGIPQTFEYFERMQERILDFIVRNSNVQKDRLRNLMLDTGKLAKDVGSILVGIEAVHEGIIDEIGGIHEAFDKLYQMINDRNPDNFENNVEENNEKQVKNKGKKPAVKKGDKKQGK
ncbi:MAG: peptidase ClpP [Clostridiales bacterium]|jgi:ATP-dependent protease ClpP protease subunit|nr:peptidase ClpP [Clostridiales bacterium]